MIFLSIIGIYILIIVLLNLYSFVYWWLTVKSGEHISGAGAIIMITPFVSLIPIANMLVLLMYVLHSFVLIGRIVNNWRNKK